MASRAKQQTTSQHYTVGQSLSLVAFQAIQKLSSPAAAALAYQLWFHPSRTAKSRRRIFSPPGTQQQLLKAANKRFPCWSAGEGQTVLLVHGWSGWGGQMAAFAEALLKQGYRVIWFDAPAHGQASGWRTHIFELSEALRAIESRYRGIGYVVAHSFGLPATFRAVIDGMQVEKIVAMSAPSNMKDLVKSFCHAIGASDRVHDRLIVGLEKNFGSDIWQRISAIDMAESITQPVYLFHDRQDQWVSVKNSLALKRKLNDVNLTITEGLGHHRILRDESVINAALEFLTTQETERKQYHSGV